ncbi:MAG: hypothetical protein K6G07_08330, partial [Lachnospiraceae bacterium]|nr:hypothetical protein [Lachnospiraceae bacterium]
MDNNNLMGEENKQLNQAPIQQAVNVEDMQEQYRPQELDITQFTEEQRHYTTNRSKRQIREDNIRIETLETTGFHSVEEKMQTRAQKMQNDSELLLRDKKWYRLFDSESEEMKHVKSSVAYLNNVLSGPVPRLATGAINAQQMKKDVMSAYITAFHACDKYLKSHKLKGKHSTGERRKQKVKQMISTIGKDQKLFEVAVDNALGMLQGTQSIQHPRELLERTRAQEAKIARFMTEGNSSDVYRVKIKGLDKLKEKRKDETDEEHLKRLKRYQLTEESLYVKKDEKLLNEDFDGYLKRRIATLTHSKEKRQQIMDMLKQPDMVETLREFSLKETERAESLAGDKKITEEEAAKRKEAVAFNEADPESLYRIYGVMKEDEIALKDRKIEQKIKKLKNAKTAEEVNAIDQFVIDTNKEIFDIRNAREEYRLEGKVKDTDYTFALRILGAIKNKVDAAGDNKKAVTEKYLKLFAHDFDGFFAGLADYNNQIERLNGDKDGLRAVIAGIKGQYNNDPEKIPAGVKIVLKSFESALEGELKTMTELEWFKDHLDMFGLKENDDVYTIIKELAEQDERGISKLMQRSMGKEAELFGQQAERSGLTNSEALAANNTASSRIAGMAGFEDVITTS